MATNSRFMLAAPEVVRDVLADPASYQYWVVGSQAIRDADPTFPAPGTKFHHTIGVGPLTVRDHKVLAAERTRLMRLPARPFVALEVSRAPVRAHTVTHPSPRGRTRAHTDSPVG